MTGDRGSPVGNDFENGVLIARQRPTKSPSPSGRGPQAVHVVRKDDPGVDVEGSAHAHLPNRVPQRVDLRGQQVRTTVEQINREEERSTRNPIATIIRHDGNMPRLKKGGMRYAFR